MPRTAAAANVANRTRVLSTAVAETAQRLDIGATDLGHIIGVSQPTASRLMAGSYELKDGSKSWELAALFVRMYRSLFSIVGNRDDLAKDWLYSANQAFGGQSPIQSIRSAQGLVTTCTYIDAHRAPT
jgi:hypothetical protein